MSFWLRYMNIHGKHQWEKILFLFPLLNESVVQQVQRWLSTTFNLKLSSYVMFTPFWLRLCRTRSYGNRFPEEAVFLFYPSCSNTMPHFVKTYVPKLLRELFTALVDALEEQILRFFVRLCRNNSKRKVLRCVWPMTKRIICHRLWIWFPSCKLPDICRYLDRIIWRFNPCRDCAEYQTKFLVFRICL